MRFTSAVQDYGGGSAEGGARGGPECADPGIGRKRDGEGNPGSLHPQRRHGAKSVREGELSGDSGTLLESELFGFEKGAFTAPSRQSPGAWKWLRGHLFLDEIAELDQSLQAKLLHVLQDGSFARIGGHDERHMDARVSAPPTANCKAKSSRAHSARPFLSHQRDQHHAPSLRERREDIPVLVEYLRQKFNLRFQRDAAPLSGNAAPAPAPGVARQRARAGKLHGPLRHPGLGRAFYGERPNARPRTWPMKSPRTGRFPEAHFATGYAAHGTRSDLTGATSQSLEPAQGCRSAENQLSRLAL